MTATTRLSTRTRIVLLRVLAVFLVVYATSLLMIVFNLPLPTNIDAELFSVNSLLHPTGANAQCSHQLHYRQLESSPVNPKFAYVFLMAGCKPKEADRYIGYILNILISKHVLNKSGSKADVVVLVRMSSETEEETIEEQKMLEKAGVIVRYLPKAHTDNFYSAMLDKFQILKMVEYHRVLFLDSDTAPFCNLDYLFELSSGPEAILAPNLVLAYKHEPSQGGFFMIEPKEGDYERLMEIVEYRMRNYYNFSEEYGWGHKINPPDYWHDMNTKNGTLWDFYGAYADQGLLYHWVKYEKSDVSIIQFGRMERWGEVDPETQQQLHLGPILVQEVPPRLNKTIGIIKGCTWKDHGIPSCGGLKMKFKRDYHISEHTPYVDFHHFTGSNKPWFNWKRPKNVTKRLRKIQDNKEITDPILWWYYEFNQMKIEFGIDIDMENFKSRRPKLGVTVPKTYMYNYIDKHREISGNASGRVDLTEKGPSN